MSIGELFAGYGGLGMAVQAVYGGALAWYSEFDDAPSKIMAHHHPGVPNHGDITAIRWDDVEPVDILTGGFPCQDVSVAGRRAGMRDGTRSGLWAHMRTAIDQLRPGLVVIENVGGLFSAEANRIVEPCDYHMGDADSGGHTVLLRAADAVLGDLATLGYDAEWTALRAADVGAPHGRLRVFITAHPADSDRSGLERVGRIEPVERDAHGRSSPHEVRDGAEPPALTLLPTPRTTDMNGAGHHGTGGMDLRTAVTLLPTPRATDGTKGGPNQRGSSGDLMLPSAVQPERFGYYAPVIHRWEQVMGRHAPDPTEPGKRRIRLAPRFVEWMMGLPDGHVTDVPGLTPNQQLKALGNGVVPQQGAAALDHLHRIRASEAARIYLWKEGE